LKPFLARFRNVNRHTIRDRNMDRHELERWLEAEGGGEDDAADAAFARLFTAVPRIEPSQAFIEQTVTATWRWRARRRRLVAFGWAAALVLVAVAATTAYIASPRIGTAVVRAFAFVSGHSLAWLVAYAKVAMDWWWTLGRVGSLIAAELVTPARVVAVVGVELVGIVAFFALQRIAGAGRLGDAQV